MRLSLAEKRGGGGGGYRGMDGGEGGGGSRVREEVARGAWVRCFNVTRHVTLRHDASLSPPSCDCVSAVSLPCLSSRRTWVKTAVSAGSSNFDKISTGKKHTIFTCDITLSYLPGVHFNVHSNNTESYGEKEKYDMHIFLFKKIVLRSTTLAKNPSLNQKHFQV